MTVPTEKTLVLIKPGAIKRGIQYRILQRFIDAGLKVVGEMMVQYNGYCAEKHYQ